MRIIDVSGFGHSGKGVVCDILKEINNFHVSEYNFEFNLLRIQGGLLDLKNSLVDNWSPIRSDASIKRFKNLILRVGPKASLTNINSIFYSNGMNYDIFFNKKFTEISNNYIQSLIEFSYKGEWPYSSIEKSPIEQFKNRLLNQIGLSFHKKEEIHVSSGKNFLEKTRNFLNDLFTEFNKKNSGNIVVNNAFEPFDPVSSIDLFHDAKAIIVQRDPRDIFCSTIKSLENKIHIPDYDNNNYHKNLKRDFLNTSDINMFIERQKIYYEKVNSFSSSKILRIKFEDIVTNYESKIKDIYNFLEIKKKDHQNKFKFFKPEHSIKNVGIHKYYDNKKNISHIENELKQYCF